MNWVLVLHENPLVRDTTVALLEEVLRQKVFVAGNLKDARKLFARHGSVNCTLVVSSLSPPADALASQPLDRTQATATALLEQLHDDEVLIPWIFLVSFDDGTRVPDFSNTPNIEVMNVRDIARALRERATAWTGDAMPVPRRADVEISLMDGVCTWSLRGTSGTAIECSGVIPLDHGALNALTAASRQEALTDASGLGKIGRELYMQLLANNVKSGLASALSTAVGPTVKDARFRFCVDETSNELLVEALGKPSSADPDSALNHWMLDAPIFRKYRGSGGRYPLFKDRSSQAKSVSCLIIQGTSNAFEQIYELPSGEFVPVSLGAISQAAAEARAVYGYLGKSPADFGLAPPVLLQPHGHENYGDVVRAKLASKPWQLIHYVGHSSISERKTAFLALGEEPTGALEIADLARLAPAAQFVFLSSCQSSSAQFVRELVIRNIPAVLGYAWPVDDSLARLFAKMFYTNLFENGLSKRFLEYAFMNSKRGLHISRPNQTAWASPLLFMQTLGSESRVH